MSFTPPETTARGGVSLPSLVSPHDKASDAVAFAEDEEEHATHGTGTAEFKDADAGEPARRVSDDDDISDVLLRAEADSEAVGQARRVTAAAAAGAADAQRGGASRPFAYMHEVCRGVSCGPAATFAYSWHSVRECTRAHVHLV